MLNFFNYQFRNRMSLSCSVQVRCDASKCFILWKASTAMPLTHS